MLKRKGIWFPIVFIVLASIACSIPVIDNVFKAEPTPSSAEVPTASVAGPSPTPLPPLPPTLIEVEPAIGEEIGPESPITLYFDQPMDAASVESALTMEPDVPADLTWIDNSTLKYAPVEPLALSATFNMTIKEDARSSFGLPLKHEIQIPLVTAGFLEVTQVIPQANAVDIDPHSAITVVFNRPVVPLEVGGDPIQPLTFTPPASGEGHWISTSIYRFQPDIPFPGGSSIQVRIGTELEDVRGGRLSEDYKWSFTTSLPEIISLNPVPGIGDALLNQKFTVKFNQSMDPLQTQQAFSIETADGNPIPGNFNWEADGSVLNFQPSIFLDYDQRYTLSISKDAKNPQGTPLTHSVKYSFDTIPRPEVVASSPRQGGVKAYNKLLSITFASPMDQASVLEAISLSPEVENMGGFWRESTKEWVIHGDFEPTTAYQLTLDDSAQDLMGTPLQSAYRLRFSTADMPPLLSFPRYNEVLTLTTYRPQKVDLLVRNLTRLDLSLYRLSLDEFFSLLRSSSYSYPEPTPSGELLREWSQPITSNRNVTEMFKLPLEPQDLASGVYMLIVDSPDDPDKAIVRLLVVRDVELVIKSTVENALLWAVDLSDGQPVPNYLTRLYANDGVELGRGETDDDGILQLDFPRLQDPYDRVFAVCGTPGEPGFGFTASTWADGIGSYEFGIWMNPDLQNTEVYLYTDRPIYRPGQTIQFRGILRDNQNDRYELPSAVTFPVELLDSFGDQIQSMVTTVSPYGTFQGSFTLNQDADLGDYQIASEYGSVVFQVAAYRKPEYLVSITPSAMEVTQGDSVTAVIEAEFFFGGPVTGAEVKWEAYATPTFPIGIPQTVNWFARSNWYYPHYQFNSLATGEGTTDEKGSITIEIPTSVEEQGPHKVTIEVTLTDSGGVPVTESESLILHPAKVYLSLDPDRYSIREDQTALVRLSALDWNGKLIPGQVAQIDVERVVWKQVASQTGRITYESQATLVNHATLTTAEDGTVLFSFKPETSGTYRVSAWSKDLNGRHTQTELTIWVSGLESRLWQQPAAERIVLVPDKQSYAPGEMASIFIPSPFDEPVEALATIERRGVLSHQVITIDGNDTNLSLPIEEQHIPNIFVSVVLIRPATQEKSEAVAVGYVDLDVDAGINRLNVHLTSIPAVAEPRGTITYELLVTDTSGNPVQAEFSLALVDLAVLSLADPNSETPMDALYAHRTLGVRTGASISLKAEGIEPLEVPDGLGGGGGGPTFMQVRSEFPDTAYWNPSVTTDAGGRAQISLTLPDSLTTWRLDVRGVTRETLVGSATLDVVTTKELIIRPITPRFFTAGDAATVAAIVHNNTNQELSAEVRLSASGAEVVDSLTQRIRISPEGQERVDWDLIVQDVDGVALTYFVSGGGLEDSSTPTIGTAQDGILPVLRYSAPDSVATAGELSDESVRLEAISLPRSYDASQGELRIKLDPSLGAALIASLEAFDYSAFDTPERLISHFLPNLYTYLALQQTGVNDPVLETRLQTALDETIQVLYQRQNWDGGWGWWRNSPSDIYLTAYSLLAMAEAKNAGFQIDQEVIDSAVEFLHAGIIQPGLTSNADYLDRQCLVLYALSLMDEPDHLAVLVMATQHELLSTWARALLATMLSRSEVSSAELDTIVAQLESSAIQSATGTHWQEDSINHRNLESNIKTTAMALIALREANPSSSIIPGAVRWLLASRDQDGLWFSSHDTAWAMSALAGWLQTNNNLQSNYDFMLRLNGQTLTTGTTTADAALTSIEIHTPVGDLLPEQPNQMAIQRGTGDGRLFYSAHLNLYRPVEDVEEKSRGLNVYREYFYYDGECGQVEKPCPKAASATVGDDLLVRITLAVPTDQYHVILNDPFPAGMDPIETGWLASALDHISMDDGLVGDTSRIYGWWYFSHVEIRDDHLALYAEHLPAGTYQYTYHLHAILPGEYRVLPTRAWASFFPEIYGQSAGEVFSIKP